MALNIEKILSHIGETKEEFSSNVDISLERLDELIEGKQKITERELADITGYTDLPPEDICSEFATSKGKATDEYNPSYTWSPSKSAKDNLRQYVSEGANFFNKKDVKRMISQIDMCIDGLRKPKISFAGQTDTGKSTLINCLLGSDNLPAKWTPTTSIAVYIKHISDRPSFMTENVWVFRNDGEIIWDDNKYQDQAYCESLVIAKGDLDLLETLGTHHEDENKLASSAVVFLDSDILKNCDIVDLPGFAAADQKDNVIHQFVALGGVGRLVDVLIYLSRANGFMQGNDIDYLNTCLRVLRPVERKDQNSIKKLGNLFIVASQAETVENGNVQALNRIMDEQCKALCKPMHLVAKKLQTHSYLPERSKYTKYAYSEPDFRARFFTFEKESPRLCKAFRNDFLELVELLPDVIFKDFTEALRKQTEHSKASLEKKIDEYIGAIEEQEEYRKVWSELKEKEPARRIKVDELKRQIQADINDFKLENCQDFDRFYTEYMTKQNLTDIIDENGFKFKKADMKSFETIVYQTLQGYCEQIIQGKSDEYSKKVDKYLDLYEKATLTTIKKSKIRGFSFNSTDAFASAAIGLGAIGASASWLATAGLGGTIFGAVMEGVGMAPLIALIGGIGAMILGVVLGILAIVSFTALWKKNLVDTTIKQYAKNDVKEKIIVGIKKYWDDTKRSFDKSSDALEEEWADKLSEMESACQEANIPQLKKDLKELRAAFDFFTKMPLPDKV